MKKVILILLTLLPTFLLAQVKGNKKIVTETFSIEGVNFLEMNLYAEVEIDASVSSNLQITADENLIKLIETATQGNKLVLTQKEWIQPSQKIKIVVGGANLKSVDLSVHETVQIKNLDRDKFNARAILGKLVLSGKVNQLSASGEIGEIDARKVISEEVYVNLWDRGKIVLGSPEKITGQVEKNGRLIYNSDQSKVSVITKSEGEIENLAEVSTKMKIDTKFIEFKLKNNSFNRINLYVKGPKPDGSYFSYGFPMNPGQVREKNWTVGSKVYRVTGLGTRKLLTVIEANDEDQTIKLYGEE